MKNNLYILILILCLGNIAKAQNFVPNGYFEVYDTCPNNQYQIRYANNWLNAGGTPDYFNACANISSGFNVPNTVVDYQQDCCNGMGYAGIFNWASSGTNAGREYMQIKLNDSLIAGHKYLSSMYVNRSRSEGWAIATIGMLFLDTAVIVPPTLDNFINVPNPQVKNNFILKDTINWIMVQDTFVASSNKKYLAIGNFSTDSLSDTLKIITNGADYFQAYYYIDGVSVYKIDGTCNNYWDAGYGKYIKAGDSIRLGAINTDNSTYSWQNSLGGNTYLSSNIDARPWCKPMQTTTYYVIKKCPNNNIFTDTVTVYVQSTVGIQKFEDNVTIKLYPNPNNGNMSIAYNLTENARLEITNVTGNIVAGYSMPVTSNTLQIKNNDLQNGIYFYRVLSNDKLIKLGKFVVMQ